MISHSAYIDRVVAGVEPIRSIELAGAKASVVFRLGEVEVLVVELAGRSSFADPSLWGRASWHLVVEGRALVQQDPQSWEILPSRWLALTGPQAYRIANPDDERLRLFSIVVGANATAEGPQS